MKKISRIATALMLAGGLSLAAVPAVQAGSGHERGMGKDCPMERMGHHGQNHGHKGGHGYHRDGGFFKGLDLTEAQQDKIFEIKHALAPAKRTYFKESRKLRKQQKELVQSGNYDSGKMKKLVEQETRLLAEHRMRMADTQNRMYQVLTEEQRKQLAERQEKRRSK